MGMAADKAIEILKQRECCRECVADCSCDECDNAFDMAIKALEQKSVIDKIKAEITDSGAYEQEVHGKTEFLKGINYCLGVINAYYTDQEVNQNG